MQRNVLYNGDKFDPRMFVSTILSQHLSEEAYLLKSHPDNTHIGLINFETQIIVHKIYYTYDQNQKVVSAEIDQRQLPMWLESFNSFYNFDIDFEIKIFNTFPYKVFADAYQEKSLLYPFNKSFNLMSSNIHV